MPAQKSLEAADATGIELDQRLEIDLQFALGLCLAQVDFQRTAGAHRFLHRWISNSW